MGHSVRNPLSLYRNPKPNIRLTLLSGQEEYERLRPLSYAKSHVILIAFAIDTPDSLENVVHKWIDEVRTICGPSVPVILVGCKSDLRPPNYQGGNGASSSSTEEDQFVTTEKGRRVAMEIGARDYKECSALKVEGVDDIFEAATRASMLVREGGVNSRRQHQKNDLDDDDSRCCVIC